MIAQLRGKIAQKDASGLIIDCSGVGYGVSASLSTLTRLGEVGSDAQLLIHTHVAQDSLRLFGFYDAAEKRCFEVLIAVSGVGPKLALAVLSTLSPAELVLAVESGDEVMLVRVPGVGKKKAQRLLLELKDRLPSGGPAAAVTNLRHDLKGALEDLGFNPAAAIKAAEATLAEHPGQTDLAMLVRAALRATAD